MAVGNCRFDDGLRDMVQKHSLVFNVKNSDIWYCGTMMMFGIIFSEVDDDRSLHGSYYNIFINVYDFYLQKLFEKD